MGVTNLSGLQVAGVPIHGPGIPASYGQAFFVDSDYGSDSASGTRMDDPFASLPTAYGAARTNRNDVIVLSGVGAHVLTDELTVSKSRLHFVGLDAGYGRLMGQRSRITMGATTGSAIAAIQNTGVGNTFRNLKITSTDDLSTSLYCFADGGEYTLLDHVWLEKNEDLNQTTAAELLCNADTPTYLNCVIGNTIYERSVARACILFTRETISGKVARDVYFEGGFVLNKTSASTSIHAKATTTDIERLCVFKDVVFLTAKTSSATQAVVFGIASALTAGEILLKDCVVQNVTDVCATGLGVFTNSVTPVATGTESVSVAVS